MDMFKHSDKVFVAGENRVYLGDGTMYVADITGVYIFKDISVPCYKRSHVINSFDAANIAKLP